MKTVLTMCKFGPDAPPEPAAGRADRVVQELTGLSRAAVRGLFDHGCVSVNGQMELKPQAAVRSGDIVEVQYDPRRRYKEQPRAKADPAFDVLFEDERLIVVNKSPHVFTVPTATDKGKTLIAAVEQHVNFNRPKHSRRRVHVIHRLDRGVSGVLVIAKSARVADDLQSQFASRKPQRVYVAIVSGTLERNQGMFRTYMATGRTLNRYSTGKPGKGELAITHYEAIENPLPSREEGRARGHSRAERAQSSDFTVVRVTLETGRRNQIRVHFAEAGHPVLGDRRYGKDQSSHPRWKAKRIALHAKSLEFIHPVTGKSMRFEAPLPREFEPFMRGRSAAHRS